jgi:hypothetical protein
MPEEPVTISGKDGDDAPRYLEKRVGLVLKKLKEMEEKTEE